jgi:hypothetical protein
LPFQSDGGNTINRDIVRQSRTFRISDVRAGIAGGRGVLVVQRAGVCRLDTGQRVLDLTLWKAEYTREQWRQVLASTAEDESFGRRLQEASRLGRPLGGRQLR